MNTKKQKRLGVGIIIQNQDGDFLLHLRDENTRNMPNQWSLVGGEVEQGERAEDAVLREIKEETGLTTQNPILFSTISFDEKWDAIIFHALVNTDHEKLVLNEGKRLLFVPKEKVSSFINDLSYSNPFLDILKSYLNT
jgi:mutator protein MutT